VRHGLDITPVLIATIEQGLGVRGSGLGAEEQGTGDREQVIGNRKKRVRSQGSREIG
jgi:hypothetical protein